MNAKGWIIFSIIIVALLGGLIWLQNSKKEAITTTIGEHTAGNQSAKVTLEEYGDYQCPGCGQVEPTIAKLRKDFGATSHLLATTQMHVQQLPQLKQQDCKVNSGKCTMHSMATKVLGKIYAAQNVTATSKTKHKPSASILTSSRATLKVTT